VLVALTGDGLVADDDEEEAIYGAVPMVVETREVVVGLSKQSSELPWLTVITGVPLACPLESPRRITTSVPAGIVTAFQVYEVPLMALKTARTEPSALPSWKDWGECQKFAFKNASQYTNKAEWC